MAQAALLLALAMVAPVRGPMPPPPPTVWARAGARGWTICGALERKVAEARPQARGSGDDGASAWQRRARQCPHLPSVALRAAIVEIGSTATNTLSSESAQEVDAIARNNHARLQSALRWLRTAAAEADRRREPPPLGTLYHQGRVLLALGETAQARAVLHEAVRNGDVERWQGDVALALAFLFEGELEPALAHAHRAVRDTPITETWAMAGAHHVLALVLDRSDASAEARRELEVLRRRFRTAAPAAEIELMMPVHERLFLRALVQQGAGNDRNAARLWELYLARPEPETPERKLVERHLAALRLLPAPVEPAGSVSAEESDGP